MKVTIEGRETALREQLRARLSERLTQTGNLRCAEHGGPVVAVSIHGRENGWYDTMWTTCCEALERQASAILKKRL